jgi:hypothetical protein
MSYIGILILEQFNKSYWITVNVLWLGEDGSIVLDNVRLLTTFAKRLLGAYVLILYSFLSMWEFCLTSLCKNHLQ